MKFGGETASRDNFVNSVKFGVLIVADHAPINGENNIFIDFINDVKNRQSDCALDPRG